MPETNVKSSAEEDSGGHSDRLGVLSCPRCGSERLHRSHRYNAYERTILKILGIRPYRCESCNARFNSRKRRLAH